MNQVSKYPPVLVSLSRKPSGVARSFGGVLLVKDFTERAKVFQVSLMHRGRPSRASKEPRSQGIPLSSLVGQDIKFQRAVGSPQGLVNQAVQFCSFCIETYKMVARLRETKAENDLDDEGCVSNMATIGDAQIDMGSFQDKSITLGDPMMLLFDGMMLFFGASFPCFEILLMLLLFDGMMLVFCASFPCFVSIPMSL
ncbi:hypothetical protein RHMOL_Rhmol02G0211200 [Rhododendron molle]|uniref:Uncharacterized protein n=1 Tax=Rhododendron molle TaxID=49168 RepID=A0ACC0PVJ8_RHOML|nr:hypothetical protein RHMOL_Rhmol02G0211200 [Rhododendron molle]